MIFDSVENKRTTYCGLIDDKFLDQPVCIYGWVHRRRDHGGVIFLDIRDREGLVQCVFDPSHDSAFKLADKVRNEFVLLIKVRLEIGLKSLSIQIYEVEKLKFSLKKYLYLIRAKIHPLQLTMKN